MNKQYLQTMRNEWNHSKDSHIYKAPLYHQLYTLLRTSILNGTVGFNIQMPTEQELEATFKVSRITAKRAMDELASDNLITRQRGKGSHVKYRYKPKPVSAPLVDMLENLIEMGIHSIVRVLSIAEVIPPARIVETLNLRENQTVMKVVRVRSDEEGMAFAHYVSWTVGVTKGFTKDRLESTPRLNILEENNIKLAEVKQTLSACNASDDIAQELNMSKGDALLSITRHSYNKSDEVIDIIDCLYNPRLFNYSMVLTLD
tara:strand:+ start:126 stop:902 length:777 start_codon:yes stop_codon:yes gene_type:complete